MTSRPGRAPGALAAIVALTALAAGASIAACRADRVDPASTVDEAPVSATSAPTATPDPWAGLGAPARIAIPAVDIDAPLERLGLTPDQAIDVPKAWGNAGWYDAGFRPGEPGNAIISGHFDDDRGAAAVFYRLRELAPGDPVYVDYPGGERYAFRVEDSRLLDADAVDAAVWEDVFGPSAEPRLSLITCDGVWDKRAGSYDKRLVLHAGYDPAASTPAAIP